MISNMEISTSQYVFNLKGNLRLESVDRSRIRQNPFLMAKTSRDQSNAYSKSVKGYVANHDIMGRDRAIFGPKTLCFVACRVSRVINNPLSFPAALHHIPFKFQHGLMRAISAQANFGILLLRTDSVP